MRFIFTAKIKIFLSFSLVLLSASLSAQLVSVSFKIMNQKREPISFASVLVINRTDTLQTTINTADSVGLVSFRFPVGQYIVRISSVNYQPVEKGITVSNHQNFFNFIAEPLPKILGDVVVTSKKPLMTQEDDKTIIDPENLIAASTNSYEVIEKTPGLFVDQDGNIYISSLSPAAIQINGRDMKMSAADVATLLKSLPADGILKIEIVRSPSAKYDAASTGGIVNVVLKKGIKIGMTGSSKYRHTARRIWKQVYWF
jgi:hypothetical protein